MKNQNKRDLILDAMQELMFAADVKTISVSDIALKAGIGKGSIYYYFSSKNEIIEAVIERSYSRVLDKGQALAASANIGVFQKMKIIYQACLESSLELKRQEARGTFKQQQQSALIHQKFFEMIITRLEPILQDIIGQGIREGVIQCEYPKETARIILIVLTFIQDHCLASINSEQQQETLTAFARMLETFMGISNSQLDFLAEKIP